MDTVSNQPRNETQPGSSRTTGARNSSGEAPFRLSWTVLPVPRPHGGGPLVRPGHNRLQCRNRER